MKKMLLIDDNIHQHKLFECYVAMCDDVELKMALNLEEALNLLQADDPDIVFLDNRLHPYESFSETVPILRARGFKGKIVVISANITASMIIEFKSKSVAAILEKSDINLNNFNAKVETLLLN